MKESRNLSRTRNHRRSFEREKKEKKEEEKENGHGARTVRIERRLKLHRSRSARLFRSRSLRSFAPKLESLGTNTIVGVSRAVSATGDRLLGFSTMGTRNRRARNRDVISWMFETILVVRGQFRSTVSRVFAYREFVFVSKSWKLWYRSYRKSYETLEYHFFV